MDDRYYLDFKEHASRMARRVEQRSRRRARILKDNPVLEGAKDRAKEQFGSLGSGSSPEDFFAALATQVKFSAAMLEIIPHERPEAAIDVIHGVCEDFLLTMIGLMAVDPATRILLHLPLGVAGGDADMVSHQAVFEQAKLTKRLYTGFRYRGVAALTIADDQDARIALFLFHGEEDGPLSETDLRRLELMRGVLATAVEDMDLPRGRCRPPVVRAVAERTRAAAGRAAYVLLDPEQNGALVEASYPALELASAYLPDGASLRELGGDIDGLAPGSEIRSRIEDPSGGAWLDVTTHMLKKGEGDAHHELILKVVEERRHVGASAPLLRQHAPSRENGAIRVFISCAPEDRSSLLALVRHLKPAERAGALVLSYAELVGAGEPTAAKIAEMFASAHLIVFLVSPDALANDRIYGEEIAAAVERNELGTACVVPVIVRHCVWERTPYGHLYSLPRGERRTVATSDNKDQTWAEIALEIWSFADQLRAPGEGPRSGKPGKPAPAPAADSG